MDFQTAVASSSDKVGYFEVFLLNPLSKGLNFVVDFVDISLQASRKILKIEIGTY